MTDREGEQPAAYKLRSSPAVPQAAATVQGPFVLSGCYSHAALTATDRQDCPAVPAWPAVLLLPAQEATTGRQNAIPRT